MGIKSFAAVMVLVLRLVVEQHIQVQALDICCPDAAARAEFDRCVADSYGILTPFCYGASGCRPYSCLSTSHISRQDSTDDVAAANVARVEFCKSGCTSAVCDSLKTAVFGNKVDERNNVIVNRCAQACSRFCTKHVVATNDVV